VIGIEGGEAIEEGSPVVAAPVLGLDFGAYADGEEGMAGGCGEYFFRSRAFCVGEVQVPACGGFEMRVSQLRQIAGEALCFGFEGLGGFLPTVVLHVVGDGDADETGDSAEAKESGVATGGLDSASRPQVDEHLGTPAEKPPPQGEEFACTARARGVAEVAVDEVGVFEDGGGRGGFGVDREVCEEAAFSVREGTGDQVEGGQCDEGVAEAA